MNDHAEQAAQDPHSTDQVQIDSPERLQHWADALSTTPEALRAAVQAVGTRIDRIKDHLAAGDAGDQAAG